MFESLCIDHLQRCG
ncbi:host-nuclease inhibitor Gam family protein, partial [Escherichia sp. SS-MK2]